MASKASDNALEISLCARLFPGHNGWPPARRVWPMMTSGIIQTVWSPVAPRCLACLVVMTVFPLTVVYSLIFYLCYEYEAYYIGFIWWIYYAFHEDMNYLQDNGLLRNFHLCSVTKSRNKLKHHLSTLPHDGAKLSGKSKWRNRWTDLAWPITQEMCPGITSLIMNIAWISDMTY